MSTILFAWELGMGLGHAAQMAPIANGLAKQGHRVFAALRDLRAGQGVFDPAVIPLPAPFKTGAAASSGEKRSLNFASILGDIGFGDERALPVLAAAWRNLFKLTRPDLIVFDHAPTALLASRGVEARRLALGVGFCVPPDVSPFPPLHARGDGEGAPIMEQVEAPLLDRANSIVESWKQRPLARLGQLYGEADRTLLTTFPEFDCYRRFRPDGASYVGPVNAGGGKAPAWPAGEGKRVFAYLKPFGAMRELLAILKERRTPSIVFIDGLNDLLVEQFACDTLRFESERVDLSAAARECDLAILNGAHASSIAMLLAGKPSLQIPLFLEHHLNAGAVRRLGAGLVAAANDRAAVVEQLGALLDADRYADAARRFAERYARFDPARQAQAMLDCAAGLLGDLH